MSVENVNTVHRIGLTSIHSTQTILPFVEEEDGNDGDDWVKGFHVPRSAPKVLYARYDWYRFSWSGPIDSSAGYSVSICHN